MRLGGSVVTPVLREAPDRLVRLEGDGATVRKVYRGADPGVQWRCAREEHGRLLLLWEHLGTRPGLACPRPVALEPGPPPALRMTVAPGDPLLEVLERPCPLTRRRAIAVRMADAIEAFVACLGVPWDDFHLRNLRYRDNDGLLSLIGVGPTPDVVDLTDPFNTSVGNLVAGIAFEAARPRGIWRWRLRRQSVEVAQLMVAELRRRGRPLPLGPVGEMALRRYEKLTADGPVRRAWYRGAGLVASPVAFVERIVGRQP